MLGIDGEDEPVHEATAVAGWPAEQPVVVRRQPEKPAMFGEGRRRPDRLTVYPAHPMGALRRVVAGAELDLAERTFE